MKKLCFGTVFTLLCQIKKDGNNQQRLYDRLVKPYQSNSMPETDSGSVSARKNGTDDFPEKSDYLSYDTNELISLYSKGLSNCIKDEAYKKAFILAIKDVLNDDTTLRNDEEIGSSQYTKEAILTSDTFEFFTLLINLVKYCCSINNIGFKDNIAEINSTFVRSFMPRTNEIDLTDESYESEMPVLTDINTGSFSRVFFEINPGVYNLSIPNPNKLKLYKLQVKNKNYNYEQLSDFILDNISNYVFSRTKRTDLIKAGRAASIGLRAVNELKSSPLYSDQIKNFSELMLYSFLECSLKAPKIYNSLDIDKMNISNFKSAGVYFLPAGTIASHNQIIFGCTKIFNDITSAVDDVFNQVVEIVNNRADDIKLFDPYVLRANLDSKSAQYIKEKILPSKSSVVSVDDAFGIFISYKIQIPNKESIPNNEYIQELDKQLDADIKNIIPYLNQKIKDNSLDSYSFYIYFLPLDDAEKDSTRIITSTIGGGDNASS